MLEVFNVSAKESGYRDGEWVKYLMLSALYLNPSLHN